MTSVRVERHLRWVTVNGQRFPRERAEDWLDAVQQGLCPFCGAGPFTVVAVHTVRLHDVSGADLRELLGLYKSDSICDATYSAAVSARQKEIMKGHPAPNVPPGRGRHLSARRREDLRTADGIAAGHEATRRENAARFARRLAALDAGTPLAEIAANEAIPVHSLRNWYRKNGRRDLGDGRRRIGTGVA